MSFKRNFVATETALDKKNKNLSYLFPSAMPLWISFFCKKYLLSGFFLKKLLKYKLRNRLIKLIIYISLENIFEMFVKGPLNNFRVRFGDIHMKWDPITRRQRLEEREPNHPVF